MKRFITRDAAVTTFMALVATACLGYLVQHAYLQKPAAAPRVLEPPIPPEPFSLEGAQLTGSVSAPIALIVYSDFSCSACQKFASETLPVLRARYLETGKLLLAFRHYPGASGDPLSYKSAQAAACAGRVNRFWQMHDALFAQRPHPLRVSAFDHIQGELQATLDRLVATAAAVGLEPAAFRACLERQSWRDVSLDAGTGVLMGVRATPALFIGPVVGSGFVQVTRRLRGAPASEVLCQIVEETLAIASTSRQE